MNSVEELVQIQVHHHAVAVLQMPLGLGDRRVTTAPRPEAVATAVKRRFVVRAQHLVWLSAGTISARCLRTSSIVCRSGPGAPSFDATFSNASFTFSSRAISSIVIAGRPLPFVLPDFGTAHGRGRGRPRSLPPSSPLGLSAVSEISSSCLSPSLAVAAFPPPALATRVTTAFRRPSGNMRKPPQFLQGHMVKASSISSHAHVHEEYYVSLRSKFRKDEYEPGSGNYTEERQSLLPDWDAPTLVRKIKDLQARRSKGA